MCVIFISHSHDQRLNDLVISCFPLLRHKMLLRRETIYFMIWKFSFESWQVRKFFLSFGDIICWKKKKKNATINQSVKFSVNNCIHMKMYLFWFLRSMNLRVEEPHWWKLPELGTYVQFSFLSVKVWGILSLQDSNVKKKLARVIQV